MTGVGRRAAHLVRAAIRRDESLRWGLITNTPEFLLRWLEEDPSSPTGLRPLPHRAELWPVAVPPEAHPGGEWWLNVALPRLLAERGAALFDGPAFLVPWRRLPIPAVLTVPDLAHRLRPPVLRWRFRLWLDVAVRSGIRAASRVITMTPSVARQIEAAHPQARGRVTVIPGGVEPDLSPWPAERTEAFRRAHGLPARYLLHVGTFEPRKNHAELLAIFTALCAEMDEPPPLVMAGAPGPMLPLVERWVERSPWRGLVHLRTGVEDALLQGLLQGAAALVFPSRAEGFGLPVLEALACGVPVLAADVTGLDFFRDSPAALLPLGSPQPWVAALRRILGDPAARQAAREQGPAWARPFSWDAAAAQLLSVYTDMLGHRA